MDGSNEFDVCIVGAGVAGGTFAAYLGRHGMKVAVVEKNIAEQERIVGELLQPGGLQKLKEMELEHLVENIEAQQVEGYGLFLNAGNFKISYPSKNGQALTGRGFRNGKFVQQIRTHLISLSSVSLIEGSVERLLEKDGRINGVSYISKTDGEEQTILAHLTVVCDGMFSQLREHLSENKKRVSSYFLGMILKDCKLPFKNHGHVIIAHPSPCLIYPISPNETRLLIDFPWSEAPRKSAELTSYFENIVAPQLPPELLPSFKAAVEGGKFKVMPNHFCPAKPIFREGAVLLGDSLNMRHPLTGGGMTVALTDIKNLGDRLIQIGNLESPAETDKAIKNFYAQRHKQNATINILADALYGVLQNEDLKMACYNYLKRGGSYAQEPISILSAMSRDADLLLRHFFAVAFFGAGNILKPYPSAARVKRSWKMMQSAVAIVKPLVMHEKPGMFTRAALKIGGAVFS